MSNYGPQLHILLPSQSPAAALQDHWAFLYTRAMEAGTASSSGQHSAKDLVSGLLGTRLKASH